MDDQTAISRIKQGDLNGLEALVGRYQVKAVYAAYLVLQDRSLAEDVAQDAFLKIYEKIHQFEDGRPFAPWFFRIVVNDAVKIARRQRRLRSLDEEPEEQPEVGKALARWMIDSARGDGGRWDGTVSAYYAGPPVGDGRTYHVLVIQTPQSQQTLENLALAGGYREVAVHGSPGIYRASCWDSTALAGGKECRQELTWFEGGAQYDLSAYFPGLVPEATLLAIADSMR